MPGFHFRLPFLNQEDTAKLTAAFPLLGASPKAAHDNLLNFLTELFDWMEGHEHAYCAEPGNKAIFYAFARLEYYNSLLPLGGGREKLATACALAAMDVPLLVKLVEGFVDARRMFYNAQDEQALEAVTTGARNPAPNANGMAGAPLTKSEVRKARRASSKVAREFEKAARALTARLENQLNIGHSEHQVTTGCSGASADDDQGMQSDGGFEGRVAESKVYWSVHLLKSLGIAVDRWLECLENQGKYSRRSEWADVFGPATASASG